MFARSEGDLPGNSGEKWIGHIGDNQTHLEGFFEAQTAGELVGDKVDFFGNFPNGSGGAFTDAIPVGLTAEDAGDGGDREAGAVGDALEGGLCDGTEVGLGLGGRERRLV